MKQQSSFAKNLEIGADFVSIVAAFFLAYRVRSASGGLADLSDYMWQLLIILPVRLFFFSIFGLYAPSGPRRVAGILFSIFKAHIASAAVSSSIILLTNPRNISRGLYLYSILFSFIFVSMEKTLLKYVLACITESSDSSFS